ncbi:hypothetical protein B5C34_14385 [Pacificimonas flava]|uniref:Macrolide export ATP-binding/permease protein MacB n=2 Tax=Pacificimonas TaxID=1960290 RepID=A0A219B9S3_9SPHN|nr:MULTISPECIES: ABC transporter permease [Pacificimonas]MBZ6380012.1 ABC transporter permease [Pacificimonas aurantium]OWV34528.1 hypothetical protein B5C34_14385 [Pacificimonas flava]
MMLRANIEIALNGLGANMLRSVLTTIGIVIGVASVVMIAALGRAAEAEITRTIDAMGENMVIIWPVADSERRGMVSTRGRLTERDGAALERDLYGVTAVAPQLQMPVQAGFEGDYAPTTLQGVDAAYLEIVATRIAEGRSFAEEELRAGRTVAVLGASVADELFGGENPLGKRIRLNRIPVEVIGVAEERGGALTGDQDDFILMPMATVRQRFREVEAGDPDAVDMMLVQFAPGMSVSEGAEEVRRLLSERYHVREGDIRPFTVFDTEEFSRQSATIIGAFQAVLISIASISLLVGGIGITNIMLVVVSERTREIGIRMATGAAPSDIRNQFLVEAAVLCAIGGLLGLILSAAATYLISAASGWAVAIPPLAAIGALLFSATIGIVAGYAPARRAARMNPIEALRAT